MSFPSCWESRRSEDNATIYSGASILGGETVIGANTIIGGNVFITKPIARDTRVRVKNQALRYDREGDAFGLFMS